MKKVRATLVFLSLLTSLLLLQNCKHEQPVSTTKSGDYDSLYVGTPYVFPILPSARYPYRNIIVPSTNPMTNEGVYLGRMLFYDSTLSLNKKFSCASCHKQQYAFGDNTKFSKNVLGYTVRNTPPLMNLGMNQDIVNSKKYFWDGRQGSIEDAVDDAFNHELRPDFASVISYLSNSPQYAYLFKKAFGRPGDITVEKIEKAIAQFVRSMVSANSRIDQYYSGQLSSLTTSEAAGLAALADPVQGDCFHCHTDGPFLTFITEQLQFQNNGLDSTSSYYGFADLGLGAITGNEHDNGLFKIPSLRNVAVSAPYMHDGRFASLENVINHYSDSLCYSPSVNIANLQYVHTGGLHLNPVQKANLLALLNALTDTSFIHNPAYSDPFH